MNLNNLKILFYHKKNEIALSFINKSFFTSQNHREMIQRLS